MCEMWSKQYGKSIQIGPDSDGTEMVEVLSKFNEKNYFKILFPIQQARQVALAILDCVDEMEKSNNKLCPMEMKKYSVFDSCAVSHLVSLNFLLETVHRCN